MSMIFHRFPNVEEATMFMSAVVTDHGLTCSIYATASAAQEADPFPGELVPPIVHVERHDGRETEAEVEALVSAYGGRFAGT